jgi:hypothetical protein
LINRHPTAESAVTKVYIVSVLRLKGGHRMEFTRKDFERILGSRGIPWNHRAVWEKEFIRYAPGDPDGVIQAALYEGAPHDISAKALQAAYRLCVERSHRAPGVIMRRHAVPGADEFIFAEMRPDYPILSGGPRVHRHRGMRSSERRDHLSRSRTSRRDVARGCTEAELRRFSRLPGWEMTRGADHHGVDPGDDFPHVHLRVPKYLFPRNQAVAETVRHDHSEHGRRELAGHLYQEHDYPASRTAADDGSLGTRSRAIYPASRRPPVRPLAPSSGTRRRFPGATSGTPTRSGGIARSTLGGCRRTR